jgi:hypothetical protein
VKSRGSCSRAQRLVWIAVTGDIDRLSGFWTRCLQRTVVTRGQGPANGRDRRGHGRREDCPRRDLHLLGSLGLTWVFGNPGSTQQTFLQNFPDDFAYALVSVSTAEGKAAR